MKEYIDIKIPYWFYASETGYEPKTTFWEDFSIADHFGLEAVQDTFNRAFNEWKDNTVYLTELVLVLNHKIWYWYEKRESYATLYNALWKKADSYALDHLKDEQLEYFLQATD